MRDGHRGARSRPVLLYAKGVKVKAEMKYCVERGTVSVP